MALVRVGTALQFPWTLSLRTKLLVLGATLGFSLVGLLAKHLRRRRGAAVRGNSNKTSHAVGPALKMRQSRGPISVLSQNGADVRRSLSPATQRFLQRPGSVSLSSDRHSVASTVASTMTMTPQQLGVMGMEALETAINYWEDALSGMVPHSGNQQLAISDADRSSYNHLLENILDKGYALQNDCEALFLYHNSVLFHDDVASVASSTVIIDHRRSLLLDSERRTMVSMSSMDSFVSAQAEIADLREFDEFGDLNVDVELLEFYQLGLRQFENGGIPYRSLRTELLGCHSDIEYLAKLHCVRLAFQYLFQNDGVRAYFVEIGQQLVVDLLIKAKRDPKELLVAFDVLMEYTQEDVHWSQIEEELRGRGVRCMTFFDIVLDFIFLDAFEDLENPPGSVTAVVQNRWLSNGFKEMALSTAVWSVLKAKRRILKFPDGFISRFYGISEHLSPVLCWGFLGPEGYLKDLCHFFKDQVLGLLNDIFSFHKSKYTTLEDLARDIVEHTKFHYEIMSQRLSL